MRPSNNLETKIPSDTYRRVQQVYMKDHAHTSVEPRLKYNQQQTPLTSQGLLDILNELESYGNIVFSY